MILNSRMKNLIESNGIDLENLPRPPDALCRIVDSGFVRTNDSIVLKTQASGARSVKLSDFPDETGYEAFVNHFHLEDYLSNDEMSTSDRLRVGIALARNLRELLRFSFPMENFAVILSVNGAHYIVRFYKIRTGQDWLVDDLETYEEEALLVFRP